MSRAMSYINGYADDDWHGSEPPEEEGQERIYMNAVSHPSWPTRTKHVQDTYGEIAK